VRPGKSIIEAKAQLYNRTPFVQTFLWWANVAVQVHEEYQAFSLPMSPTSQTMPSVRVFLSRSGNFYYGVDYTRGWTSPGTKTFRYRLRT